jgi:dinuclear metal center YbgI/SA1388 family protein
MELKEITLYLNDYLNVAAFDDDAANGLQVENSGTVAKIGVAVDACLETITKAADAGCSMLIVHHGLFWGRPFVLTGNYYKRLSALIKSDMALYAAHLPLDAHPEVGNNAQIAKKVGLVSIEPFAYYHGQPIGMRGKFSAPQRLADVAKDLEKIIGSCHRLLQFGPHMIQTVWVVSGSAYDPGLITQLHDQGIDLFITGEPKHAAYYLIQEFGLNIFYGGHYRTERFGPQALGEHISKQFGLPVVYIDAPSPF